MVVVVPASTVAAGILRPLYRRALGAQLGPFGVYTTDGVATGDDARRQIVCSSLIDDAEDLTRLKGRYLYVATGTDDGRQTRILDTGYHGPIGYLEVSRPMTTALASGVEIEISTWPCDMYLDQNGLNQLVNEALARCTVESRATFNGNGTRSYSLLDDETAIDMEQRADAVWDTFAVATGDPTEAVPYTARVDTTNGERTLVTGYSYADGETFDLRLLLAGNSLIKSGGAWGFSTTGLTDDTQAAAAPIHWVVAFGMVKALDAQQEWIEQDETLSDATRTRRLALLATKRRRWAKTANVIQMTQFPRPTPPLRDSMVTPNLTPPVSLPVVVP